MGKVFKALEKAETEQVQPQQVVSKEKITETAAAVDNKHDPPDDTALLEPIRDENAGSSSQGQWDERLADISRVDSPLSELFRNLRVRLLHPSAGAKPPRTILVLSAVPGEGKSFVVANLGIALAKSIDQHVLLANCDLRRPSLSKLFGLSYKSGLTDYLQGKNSDLSSLISKTSVDKLSILPSGMPPINPAELLGSSRMAELINELSGRYDDRVVIFDVPPTQAASETTVLAQQVDAVVLVVRWGKANKNQVKKLVDNIGKEKILGIVFNGYKMNIVESKMLDNYSSYSEQY